MNSIAFDSISRRSLLLDSRLEFLRLLRTPSFALPALIFPVMFYLLFGVLMPSGKASAGQYAQYMLATYCVFGVIAPGLFGFGVGVASDRERGLLQLKRALPAPPQNYVLAKLAMALLFAAIIFLLMLSTATLAGGVRLGPSQIVLLGLVALLGALPFCALGLLIGSSVGAQAAPAIANLIYLPMAFLSGLWMPLSVLPGFVQTLAPLWPAWHLGQLALAAVDQPSRGSALVHVLYLLLFSLLAAGLAARRLQRAP